ncbi:MAG: exodeoxyribonuclease VII small subunit [Lachnospiraceae bacterium]|nr:exodeoxyribonuclease VII small subunit [Lachnospiraceae bacterium]
MAEKKKSKEEQIDIENISIEDGFAKLNELLGLMESEDVGLEGSFDLYKQGVDLVKVLNSKLDTVEGKLTEVEEG